MRFCNTTKEPPAASVSAPSAHRWWRYTLGMLALAAGGLLALPYLTYAKTPPLPAPVQSDSPNAPQHVAADTPTATPTVAPVVFASGVWNPYSVAVASDGSVYVADTENKRVMKYASNGSNATVIASGLASPRGVAVASDGSVYVTENGNGGRLWKYASNGSNATVLVSGLISAFGVAVASDGSV